ncbi:TPA: hypothetical protein N2R15_001641 [Citrobacter amalonaticus]|nr:hypothetical protein [Citrobacter amalonaticus]
MSAAVVPEWGKRYQPLLPLRGIERQRMGNKRAGGVGYGDDNRRFANASDMTLTSISHLEMITIWLHFSHGENLARFKIPDRIV